MLIIIIILTFPADTAAESRLRRPVGGTGKAYTPARTGFVGSIFEHGGARKDRFRYV